MVVVEHINSFWDTQLKLFSEKRDRNELFRIATYINKEAERIQYVRLQGEDYMYIQYLQNLVNRALKEIKQGAFNQAAFSLQYAQDTFDNYDSQNLTKRDFDFCFHPVKGYLEYKKSQYSKAMYSMEVALDCSQYFYNIAETDAERFFYSLQQSSFEVNKARVSARMGASEQAIVVINQHLKKLEQMISGQHDSNYDQIIAMLGCQFYMQRQTVETFAEFTN